MTSLLHSELDYFSVIFSLLEIYLLGLFEFVWKGDNEAYWFVGVSIPRFPCQYNPKRKLKKKNKLTNNNKFGEHITYMYIYVCVLSPAISKVIKTRTSSYLYSHAFYPLFFSTQMIEVRHKHICKVTTAQKKRIEKKEVTMKIDCKDKELVKYVSKWKFFPFFCVWTHSQGL